jgi:hypothetical protein
MAKQRRRPKSILRLKVRGPHIKPGRIPIPELLVICEHAQTAVNRQAEVLRGKRGLRPGPTATVVKTECTLELFSIGRGSVALCFAGPEAAPQPQGELDMDIEKLGEAAVARVVKDLRAARKRRWSAASMDVGVRRSLEEMGKVLTNGITQIEWIAPAVRGKSSRVSAVFDESVRQRLAETKLFTRTPKQLDGRLEMADFKMADLKCIIHIAGGQRILCSFTTDLEDAVYDALRHLVRITGVAITNPKTRKIEQIELQALKVLDPHLGGADDFFAELTLEQLTKAQGVDPTFDLRTLNYAWPDDGDIETFLAAAGQGRSE